MNGLRWPGGWDELDIAAPPGRGRRLGAGLHPLDPGQRATGRGELLATVGARVATAAVGLKEARTMRGWAAGRIPRDRDEAARLRVLHRIVLAGVGVYGRPEVATAFLTSISPALEDQAPREVLADSPPVQAEKQLLAALRVFLTD